MLGFEELKAQIEKIRQDLTLLEAEKEKAEKEREEGEALLSELSNYSKEVRNEMDAFLQTLNQNAKRVPGCFGECYTKAVMDAMRKGKVFESMEETDSIRIGLKNKVIELDARVKDFFDQISQKIAWLEELKNALREITGEIFEWR